MTEYAKIRGRLGRNVQTETVSVWGTTNIVWDVAKYSALLINLESAAEGDVDINIDWPATGQWYFEPGDELVIIIVSGGIASRTRLTLPNGLAPAPQAQSEELTIVPAMTSTDFLIHSVCIDSGYVSFGAYTANFASRRIGRDLLDENVGFRAMNKLMKTRAASPPVDTGYTGGAYVARNFNIQHLWFNRYMGVCWAALSRGTDDTGNRAEIGRGSGNGTDWVSEHTVGYDHDITGFAGYSDGTIVASLRSEAGVTTDLFRRSTDFGASWSSVATSASYEEVADVRAYASSLMCGYVYNTRTALLSLNGSSWSPETVGSVGSITAIASHTSARPFWAGMSDGKVFRRDNAAAGGGTWTEVIDLTGQVNSIAFLGNYGVFAGTNGLLRTTVDGGDTWYNAGSWASGWVFEGAVILDGGLIVALAVDTTDYYRARLIFSWNMGRDWYSHSESDAPGSFYATSGSGGGRIFGLGGTMFAVRPLGSVGSAQILISGKLNPGIEKLT